VGTLFIANNCTRESGSFMGDQLCMVKAAHLFVEHAPPDTDKVVMSASLANEMYFLWTKFIRTHRVELVHDNWNPGDWGTRWVAWDRWRAERKINDIPFDHYRELYLRIHGAQRQTILCGSERGLGRRNIYSYWWCGQEGNPEELPSSVDWFDDTLIDHPPHVPLRDVYISPHCKTQGNHTFTFNFWAAVVHRLLDTGVSVTVGYDGWFCENLNNHPLYKKHWGDHRQWMEQICSHKLVACGNTGTGWLAAACGVPMLTVEPHNSVMADHRYRQCGLRNIVEMVDGHKLDEMNNDMDRVAAYCADRIISLVNRCVVATTGCYDVLHAGHIRHLERSRALGTKLVVAMNNDESVRRLKGPQRPINPEGQRKVVLESLRCVDEVVITEEPMDFIKQLKPDVLTNGYGYTLGSVVGRDFVESYGGKVVITCPADAKDEPSTTKTVQRIRQADVVDICNAGASVSCNPFAKLKLMADVFLRVKDLPGDVADLGAYRGGASLILRRLAPEKYLHIFDTWDGTPYDDPLCHHKKGEWVTSLDECKQLVGTDDLTCYHQGIFHGFVGNKADYPRSESREYCFVYVDMDTEQATRDAIEFFWPRMAHGGVMMFDDYAWEPCAGVKKAVDEMFSGRTTNIAIIQEQCACLATK
jgi:D-glycero-beta-D-manno-heptose 1-phosphate adenylyltransferase